MTDTSERIEGYLRHILDAIDRATTYANKAVTFAAFEQDVLLQTVVAEKFEAMVQLGMTNSRMKDYYDLWFMSRHFEFEGSTLAEAVRATFNRRGTVIPGRSPIAPTVDRPVHDAIAVVKK